MSKTIRNILFFVVLSLTFLLVGCGPVTPPAANATVAASPAATQNLSVEVDTKAGGPQIVQQSPMTGERLALAGSIQLVFDRDMDKDKTAAAWTVSDPVGKPVNGSVSWKDARTLIFQPTAKLKPSTTYTGALAPLAVATDGTSPETVVKLTFQTTDTLAIGQVFPADTTENIAVGSTITVIFNRPVVSLTVKEEQSKLPQPLKISPEVKGQGEWLNSSVYIFQPEQPLVSGKEYNVSVAAGLKDTIGNTLDQDYSWKFSTRAPEVGSLTLVQDENYYQTQQSLLPLDQAFMIDFPQPMDAASVTKALTVVNYETKKNFSTKLTWNDDFTLLTITPVGHYAMASFYDLKLAETAQAKSGGPLKAGLTYSFSTVQYPAIKSVYPTNGAKQTAFDSSMSIEFKSPMKSGSMLGKIKITPPINDGKEPDLYYDEYGQKLFVSGLKAETDYVVRILPGMADLYGNTIKTEYSFSFKTGKVNPSAQILMSGLPLVYRTGSAQEFFFEHTNISSAKFSLYRVTLDEFVDRGQGGQLWNRAPSEEPIRVWEPGLLQSDNQLIRERIKLSDADGKPLKPGYYYLAFKANDLNNGTNYFYQGATFVVATDNITLKTTSTEALTWVVDLEKGLPLPDVQVAFYNAQHKELGRAKTDKDGLASIKGVLNPYIAELVTDGHVAIASNDWGSGVSPYDFGIGQSYYDPETHLPYGYVYTERPLYRSGQEVFFKGIIRDNDDLHYSLPTQTDVYVTVQQAGQQIYAETLPLSKMGTFTATLKLGEKVTLGSYDIIVYQKKGDQNPITGTSFRVAEYHKPEFLVDVVAKPVNVLVGENVTFALDASYYAGGGVSNAKVDWFTTASPYYFEPGAKYSGFSFADWDRDTYWFQQQPNFGGAIDQGTTVTDEKGHLELAQTASLLQSTTSQVVSFNANVIDTGGNLVSGSTNVTVHQSLLYAGIRAEKYVGQAGEEQSFALVALNWDASPVAGQKLTVDIVKREWKNVQEKDKQGQLRWVTSVKETPVASHLTATTDADGLAKVSFVPDAGGTYKATVTVIDSKGNSQHASSYIWISSNEYISWRQTNDRSFGLIADKDSYKPGDTAEILIAQPFPNDVYALITLERGHIYKQEVVLLKGNSTVYKLPITKEMAPVSYVSVVVVSGAQDAKAPDFKTALVRINVDTNEQSLDVSVTADKKVAGPGDEITYTVLTKDSKGNPVPAEISLSVVDKAVLALLPSTRIPILKDFYSEQGLAVITSVGIVLNAEDFNANYQETVVDGENAGGGGAGDLGIVTVRQNFKDTAFFVAQVETDENGQAKVKVTLPENLTTWQVDVIGVTADTQVGQVTSELVSTKPLFIEMQTPRFFVAGDAAQVGAVIHNNGDSALKVDVTLQADGVDLKSVAAQTVDVPARQQAYVSWDVVVRSGIRRVDFTASAKSGPLSDASKPALGTLPDQGIPVYEYTVPETVGTSGVLTDANSVTESIQLPKTLSTGRDTVLSIQVAPSLAASMKDGLTFLQDFSYLCIEQTVSRFLPNVVTAQAFKLAGAPSLTLQKDLDDNVSTALQRLYAKQLGDGGWGWWDRDTGDPQTTAYVVLGFLEARRAGYEISSDTMARAINFLKDNQISLAADDPQWKYNRQAFILYVLARYGEKPQTGLLFEKRDKLSLYGKAYLTQAIYAMDAKDKRIATLMADLNSAATVSAGGAHWEERQTDYWNWNTDVRTTAIVLDAFIKIDPKNPVTIGAVRWLMSSRVQGHWSSTQETAWTLISLTDWLVASKEYETSYPFAIGLNGIKLQDGLANQDNLTSNTEITVGLKNLLLDEVNHLVLTRGEGIGNLYYSAYLTATLPVEDIKPLDQGMVISRQYFNPTDTKTPITSANRGDLVRVQLTVILPEAAHYIVVDDPLPAGFEAVDANIATDAKAPESYTRQDFDQRGWGWWYFSHVEMRDEKIVLSTDYLPAGTYVYTYLARASTAGIFKVIPPHAAEFYFPDVGGRGAGSIFTVK